MPLDELQIPEIVTGKDAYRDPSGPTQNAVGEKGAPAHPGHSGHKRNKGTKKGDEPAKGDGPGAIFFEKALGTIEVFLVEEPPLLAAEDLVAEGDSHETIEVVPRDGRHWEKGQHYRHIHGPRGTQGPDDKEHRIAWQKGGDDQADFAENDQSDDGVNKGAVVFHQNDEKLVDVQENVEKLGYEVHGAVA